MRSCKFWSKIFNKIQKNVLFLTRLTKEKIISSIQEMPENFSFDELIQRAFVLEKIEIAEQQIIEEKVNTTIQAKQKLEKLNQKK